MYVGVDIGGTTVKIGLCDRSGKIVKRTTVPTQPARGSEAVINDIVAAVVELTSGIKYNGVGIGCPGTVDSEIGSVMYSCNLYWENVPLTQIVSERLGGCPVKACNDASAAALGENKFGAGKKYTDMTLLTLGTGVGGGIVVGGKLFDGYRGMGAELGHIIIRSGGAHCSCGRMGCLEAYTSATAIIRQTIERMLLFRTSKMWEYVGGDLNKVDGKTCFECAKLGDAAAQAVVNDFLNYLADGITDIVNVFRSQAIVIGGGVSAQGDYIIKPLQKAVDERSYGVGNSGVKTDIVAADLGNDAGILGAASLVMQI